MGIESERRFFLRYERRGDRLPFFLSFFWCCRCLFLNANAKNLVLRVKFFFFGEISVGCKIFFSDNRFLVNERLSRFFGCLVVRGEEGGRERE